MAAVDNDVEQLKQDIQRDIATLAEAIAYAARTNRMREANGMVETVLQLSHALTDGKVVSFSLHTVDRSDADNISRAMAVDVYIATQRYSNWIQEDTDRD